MVIKVYPNIKTTCTLGPNANIIVLFTAVATQAILLNYVTVEDSCVEVFM
jgi:hypothetical protein